MNVPANEHPECNLSSRSDTVDDIKKKTLSIAERAIIWSYLNLIKVHML